MSSSRVGVETRIRALAPRALYVHCNSHVLNLSIASSCQIQAIKNMIDTINETFKFFHFSPKRQRFFESILDKEIESHAVKKLKGLCKTQWVERHTCYETFYSPYPNVCLCLQEMLHPSHENARWNWDRETLGSTIYTDNVPVYHSIRYCQKYSSYCKGYCSKATKEWA